ncbi:uncharacterized protein LOC126197037 [Schistocerca nitens]|uniref:uncharacterized protein LOC126197037 n=1 Tax=Schistocerca nitens TaxID=7011 RepID=UPI00211752BC|nr:uncharacterized protein LOC126197037 [Schistocerca nitens]
MMRLLGLWGAPVARGWFCLAMVGFVAVTSAGKLCLDTPEELTALADYTYTVLRLSAIIVKTFVVALVCLWVSAPLLHHKTTDDFPDSEEGDRRPPMPIWLPEQSPAFEIVFVVQALCGTMSQQLSLLLDTSFYKLTLLVTAELQVLNDNLAVLGRTGASTERKASFPTDVPGQKREEAAIQSIKQAAAPLTEHDNSPGKLLYMQFVVNVRHHQAIIK